MNKFVIEVVSYLDREDSVAEIYYDSFQWAEISHGKKGLVVKFYPHPHKEDWEFPFSKAIEVLERAKNRVLEKLDEGNSFFLKVPPDPEQVNEQAQKILEGILNHPKKTIIQGELKRFGKIMDIYAPEMGGVRFSIEGEFIGFLEP